VVSREKVLRSWRVSEGGLEASAPTWISKAKGTKTHTPEEEKGGTHTMLFPFKRKK